MANTYIDQAEAKLQELMALAARAETAEAALAQCRDELDDLMAQRDTAEAALAARDTPCVWTVDGQGWFVSQCDGNLRRKNGKFCPACGHPVEVAP